MWVWDGLNCQGKAYEKDKCHEESSFTQK